MLLSLLALLGAAILVATLFYSVKLPPVVAFIAAGLLIGPHGLALIPTFPEVETLTEIAAILLMFTIGLEFSLKELTQYKKSILTLGLSQVLITLLAFTCIFYFGMNASIQKALFLSFLVAPSSTAVVLKLLQDNRDTASPYGKGAMSILLLQDIAIIPMLVAVPFLVSRSPLSDSFLDSLFPLILLGGLAILFLYVVGRFGLPFLFDHVSRTRNREIFFFSVIFICLGTAGFMHWIGLSYSLGAFLAGMLLAGSHYGKQATAEILPLRDSFLCLFFVAIGMLLDLSFVFENVGTIIWLSALVIGLKAAIIYAVVWITGNTGSLARATAALLFQLGEFSFILVELGRKHQLILERERQIFIAIAILSLALTPLVYAKLHKILQISNSNKWWPDKLSQKADSLRRGVQSLFSGSLNLDEIKSPDEIKDHIIIIGFGVAGQSLCRILSHIEVPFQVIDINPETVRIHSDNIPILFGDAVNPQLLKKAGIQDARAVVIVTSGIHMTEPVIRSIRQINDQIPIIARTSYLLDLQRLPENEATRIVVSELESSLKIIEETLLLLKLPGAEISQVVSSLRTEFS